jgi:acetyl-CoA acetyltransferase family protein
MSGPYARGTRAANGVPVVVDGVRTPFVKSFGVFEDTDGLELFARSVEGLLRKVPVDPRELDEIVCGAVIPQTKYTNPGREASLLLGLPDHIHGYTLNRACTSSLEAVSDIAKTIKAGRPIIGIAGGVECLSDVPIVYSKPARKFLIKLSKARSTSARLSLLSQFNAKDWLPSPPSLTEPLTGNTMGQHAEMMAKIWGISRQEQDDFAEGSHHRAANALADQKFAGEVLPIWPGPKYSHCIESDNLIRGDTSIDQLSKLRPAFDRKWGTLTAGNSSALTDGAAATLVCDQGLAKSLELSPKAIIKDMEFVGVQPSPQLLIGPAIAIPLLLKRNQLTAEDIDLFEIHEAFAAQVLCCLKAMENKEFHQKNFGDDSGLCSIAKEKLNVNGGAIAIGHPFGATGSRLVTTICNELGRRKGRYGIVAICAAGGMSGAMLLEAI